MGLWKSVWLYKWRDLGDGFLDVVSGSGGARDDLEVGGDFLGVIFCGFVEWWTLFLEGDLGGV